MRILQCHNFYRFPGGEDQVFHDESWLLKQNGHDVHHYLRDNRDIEAMSNLELVKATVWNRETVADLKRLIKNIRPEVIHFHNTFPLISTSAYHAAKKSHIPVVQTLHNYRYMCPSATLYRNGNSCHQCVNRKLAIPSVIHKCYRSNRKATAVAAAALAIQKSVKKSFHLVDRFIALSNTARMEFEKAGIPYSKMTVKPNFVRPDPGNHHVKGTHAIFVGRLTEEKGIRTLLDAWTPSSSNPISDVQLRIMGQGPMEKVVREAARSNPRISYLGQLRHSEALIEIAKARLLVFPSLWPEPFGRSMIEAFASGTPVIASNTGSMSEIVEHEIHGLHFEPGNAGELQQQVSRLSNDEHLYSKISASARTAYESKYAPQRNLDLLMKIYREAIKTAAHKVEEIHV